MTIQGRAHLKRGRKMVILIAGFKEKSTGISSGMALVFVCFTAYLILVVIDTVKNMDNSI